MELSGQRVRFLAVTVSMQLQGIKTTSSEREKKCLASLKAVERARNMSSTAAQQRRKVKSPCA
jgi:hypothetical protein